MSDSVHIKAGSRHDELMSKVTLGDLTYTVVTEDVGIKAVVVETRAFRGGQVTGTRRTQLDDTLRDSDQLGARMKELHEQAIALLLAGKLDEELGVDRMIEDIKWLVLKKSYRSAHELLVSALEYYPENPSLLSYNGLVEATAMRNPAMGIKYCRKAVSMIEAEADMALKKALLPTFMHNLCQAYLLAGKKPEAIKAIQSGLQYDPSSKGLRWEMRKLGIRKAPVFPFLDRSNPINRLLGKARFKMGK